MPLAHTIKTKVSKEDFKTISKKYYELLSAYRFMSSHEEWQEEHRRKEREKAGKPVDWVFYSDKFGLTTYDGVVEHALGVLRMRQEMECKAE